MGTIIHYRDGSLDATNIKKITCMKFKPLKVSKQVALNPVARAYAWKSLVDKSAKYKAILYAYDEGVECRTQLLDLSQYFATLLIAHDIDRPPEQEELLKALKLVLSITRTLSEHGFKWQRLHTVVFDDALDASALLLRVLKPQTIKRAFDLTESY